MGGGEVGWRGAPVPAGDWRLRAVATLALGIPSLVGGGTLSQTSDRLYSCGFADRQSRPWSATGAGGFGSSDSKLQIDGAGSRGSSQGGSGGSLERLRSHLSHTPKRKFCTNLALFILKIQNFLKICQKLEKIGDFDVFKFFIKVFFIF